MPTFPTINKYEKRDNNFAQNNSNNNTTTNAAKKPQIHVVGNSLIGRKRRIDDDASMKGGLNAKFGGDDFSKFNFRFESQK